MRRSILWPGLGLVVGLAAPALAATTQWTGVYSCAQGATALKLTVIDDDPARLTAVFAFGPTPANPGVRRGSYTLRGARQDSQMQLAPVDWLDRPEGYEMVGLAGDMAGGRFEGRIAHESCAAFSLQRRPG